MSIDLPVCIVHSAYIYSSLVPSLDPHAVAKVNKKAMYYKN